MTENEIRTKLDNLYANKKARSFFNHLVRAYFPVDKVEKVFSKPRGPFKCVISEEPLIGIGDILGGMYSDEFKTNFNTHMKTMFDSSTVAEHPMTKLMDGKKMAVSANETTTYMAFSTFQVFYDWVTTKMLMGDKHINWLLKDVLRKEFVDRAETIEDKTLQKKVKNIKKTETKQATYTLGDLDVLQQLKAKMENK